MGESGQAGGGAMSLLDPAERTLRGAKAQADLLAVPAAEPGTLFESSWRDYIFAEVWTRPGLDLRSRYLIAMASAATVGDRAATEAYVRGALVKGEATLAELRVINATCRKHLDDRKRVRKN